MSGLTSQQKRARRRYARAVAFHVNHAWNKHVAMEKAAKIAIEHKRLLEQQLTERPE